MYALYTTQKRNKQAGSNSLKQHNCNAQLADKRTQCNTVHSVQAIAGEEGGGGREVGALWTHLIPAHCVCRYYDAHSALSWPNAVDSRRTMAPLATTSLSRTPKPSTPQHPFLHPLHYFSVFGTSTILCFISNSSSLFVCFLAFELVAV